MLELKMLADVGFVGLPSVGKSTLLSAISAARPKIAAYHFTTLSPMLGVVSVGEGAGFIAADIPGLIEGASEGQGLGFDFLRHVDRCRLLVHVVDIASTEERDPCEDIKLINNELEKDSADLASRPQIIAANKCDVLDREKTDVPAFEAFCRENGYEVMYISAATGEGTRQLCARIYERLKELPPVTVYEPEYKEELPEEKLPDDITAVREDGMWKIEGEWLYHMMTGINFDDRESLSYFDKMLRDSGIITKMRTLGVKDGDTVDLYGLEFDFVD